MNIYINKKESRIKVFCLVSALVVALTGCVSQKIKLAPVLSAREVPTGELSKPLAFNKVVLKIPRSKSIGDVGVGLFCVPRAKRRVNTGRYRIDESLFSDVFRDELENHNYQVVGDKDALFGDSSMDQAEYLVAGLIKDIQANNCYPNYGFGDVISGTASAYLKVEWQIYDTLSRKVVYKLTTEGSAVQSEMVDEALEIALADAFGLATQNLLADKKFFKLVTDKEINASPKFSQKLKIRKLVLEKSKKFDFVEVRPAVVTVRTALGHGSGFFISENGYLLTNQHVVGEAKTVRIILHNGRAIPGEVIRINRVRDVALVKVGEGGFTPMSLSFREPPVGSDVMAYGTPLDESLEGTLTKGIISAYRSEKGKRFIQSDVVVHPGNSGGPMMDDAGNAIAITVSGVHDLVGSPSGHNYFIPLLDAFDKLGIKIPRSPVASN